MAGKADAKKAAEEFRAYYMRQSTKEFGEDLDKVRSSDDFKGDAALPILIESLQQGVSIFSAADRKRIADAQKAGKAADKDGDASS